MNSLGSLQWPRASRHSGRNFGHMTEITSHIQLQRGQPLGKWRKSPKQSVQLNASKLLMRPAFCCETELFVGYALERKPKELAFIQNWKCGNECLVDLSMWIDRNNTFCVNILNLYFLRWELRERLFQNGTKWSPTFSEFGNVWNKSLDTTPQLKREDILLSKAFLALLCSHWTHHAIVNGWIRCKL